jgi:hypothetical protein
MAVASGGKNGCYSMKELSGKQNYHFKKLRGSISTKYPANYQFHYLCTVLATAIQNLKSKIQN